MSRISTCLTALKSQNKKALVPYVVCGDPDVETTEKVMHALVEAGADILELGVPFSDPMAEGPVIQHAHERALENNTSLQEILALVKRFREKDDTTPVVLMGYANPIEKLGYDNFSQQAQAVGVDGVLTVDLPYEEVAEFNASLKKHALDNIFLLTPTTSELRAKSICEFASGYLYYVSLKGVTGAGHINVDDVKANYQRLTTYTELPICVGFGIKDSASATAIADFSAGVVIGSALIKTLLDKQGDQAAQEAKEWLARIRQDLDAMN